VAGAVTWACGGAGVLGTGLLIALAIGLHADLCATAPIVIGVGALGLLVSTQGVRVMRGGARMRRLERYDSVTLAALLSLLPLSPAFVLGLPAGIWALVVLRQPAVVAAFRARRPDAPLEEKEARGSPAPKRR
jgi:hypothetical protein